MKLLVVVFIAAVTSSSQFRDSERSHSASGSHPRRYALPEAAYEKLVIRRPAYQEGAAMIRSSIVRSVVVANPTWSSKQVYEAVKPLIEAAGLKQVGFDSIRRNMWTVRREMDISIPKRKLTDEQIAFMKEELAWDPRQTAPSLHNTLHAVWGDDLPSMNTITVWLRENRGATTAPHIQ